MSMHNPNTHEVYEIRGDVADPAGTGLRGQSAGIDLNNAIAHPEFVWFNPAEGINDYVTSHGDLYRDPSDESLMLIFYCPKCTEANRVTSHHDKDLQWKNGKLSIDHFLCGAACGFSAKVHNGVATDVPIG
jgi:hypothetical protein